jgi:hypothetical protein
VGWFLGLVGGPGVIMAADSLAGRGFDRAYLHCFAGRNQDNRVGPPRIVDGNFDVFLGRLTPILDVNGGDRPIKLSRYTLHGVV